MAGVTKIIFFVSSPFNERDYNRFGIEILRRNSFEVEIWDFAPFMNPERSRDKSNFEKHYIFSDKKSAISAISQLSNSCLIFSILRNHYESCAILRAISKHKLVYCTSEYNFPSFYIKKRSIFERLRSITIEKLLLYLFFRVPLKFLGIQPAAIMVAMGKKFDMSSYPIDKSTRILWTHHYDYDIYLEEIKKPLNVNKNLVVFLDNYLPFHPDFTHDFTTSPEEYYPLLCRFFDYVERENDVRIVIAAHPRSNYELHPDYFAGRDIVKGKTAELVRMASFVILHDSASVNFAVLFKKPAIFTTTDRLSQMHGLLFIDNIASLLGKRPINLDRTSEVVWNKELSINEDAYKNYKNTYIKQDGTEETPIWQAFADYLKKTIKMHHETYE